VDEGPTATMPGVLIHQRVFAYFSAMQERRVSPAQIMLGCLGAAALVTLLDASRNYIALVFLERPMPWRDALRFAAPTWLIVGMLAPLPLFMARRVTIDRHHWRAPLAMHLGGALLFSISHIVATAVYLSWPAFRGFSGVLGKTSNSFIVDMILYAAIAGVAHALRYYRHARERELAASQLQASLTEARLDALRGQLNPHFLFNTLNAISTLALEGHKDQVVKTLGYLSELLRASLDDERPQEVPLDGELDLLDRYLAIQRIRHGERLAITIDVNPAVHSALVPAMILQPLVENAITHGVARVPGHGTVGIRAWAEGDSLRLEVTDTGPGFAATSPRANGGSGIGLTNTRARLAQLYGAAQRLEMCASETGGACVSITIPLRRPASR
jgi:two-component system LytT family sensor kinase